MKRIDDDLPPDPVIEAYKETLVPQLGRRNVPTSTALPRM